MPAKNYRPFLISGKREELIPCKWVHMLVSESLHEALCFAAVCCFNDSITIELSYLNSMY